MDSGKKVSGGRSEVGDLWSGEQGKWRKVDATRPRRIEDAARQDGIEKDQAVTAEHADRTATDRASDARSHDARLVPGMAKRSSVPLGDKTPSAHPASSSPEGETPLSPDTTVEGTIRDELGRAARELNRLLATTRVRQPATTSSVESQESAIPLTAADLRKTHPTTFAPIPVTTHALTGRATPKTVPPSPPRATVEGDATTETTADPSPSHDVTFGPVRRVSARRPAPVGPESQPEEQTAHATSSDSAVSHTSRNRAKAIATSLSPLTDTVTRSLAVAGALSHGSRHSSVDRETSATRVDADALCVDDPAAIQASGAQAGATSAGSPRGGRARGNHGESDSVGRPLGGTAAYPLDDPYLTSPGTPEEIAFRRAQASHVTWTTQVVQPLATIASEIDQALTTVVQALPDRVYGPLKEEFLSRMRQGDSPYGAGTRLA